MRHVQRLLGAAALTCLMLGSASADSIVFTATADGTLVNTTTSANGTLTLNDVSFGPLFNLNSLDINSESFLAPGEFLSTNTLDVNQTGTGNHTLTLDITANGLTGPGALTALLSEFSVTGLTPGWTVQELTTINGNPLSQTPIFTGNSADLDLNSAAFLGTTFSADAHYILTSVGAGSFNGGIDIVAAVPGPKLGSGLPGLALLALGGLFLARRQTA